MFSAGFEEDRALTAKCCCLVNSSSTVWSIYNRQKANSTNSSMRRALIDVISDADAANW